MATQKGLWAQRKVSGPTISLSLASATLQAHLKKMASCAHCIGLFCFVSSCAVFSVESKTQTARCCPVKLRKKFTAEGHLLRP